MSSRLRVFGVALLVLWRVLCVFAVGVVCRRFGLRVLFLILSCVDFSQSLELGAPLTPSPHDPDLVPATSAERGIG